jgi:hypothetical protein
MLMVPPDIRGNSEKPHMDATGVPVGGVVRSTVLRAEVEVERLGGRGGSSDSESGDECDSRGARKS